MAVSPIRCSYNKLLFYPKHCELSPVRKPDSFFFLSKQANLWDLLIKLHITENDLQIIGFWMCFCHSTTLLPIFLSFSGAQWSSRVIHVFNWVVTWQGYCFLESASVISVESVLSLNHHTIFKHYKLTNYQMHTLAKLSHALFLRAFHLPYFHYF